MNKCILIILGILSVLDAGAQVRKPPKPDFEVSASLYAWDVHDEGINLMLDNLTSMSGVNSVYLITVMHQEHRPYLGPRGTGPWVYIHNPARAEWNAEDSRAYFFPKMSLYGKIKPFLSGNSWLRDTDWLKVVVDAARARGLRVGAEVSHTYLPWKEIFKTHPEYQQRDINNKPVYGPCPNNPDVREYLLALYGDIASNYDIDFIQTCMYIFSGSGLENGTCFCESCQKEAKSMGFDMAAAIPILRDNPNAQPQLDQWLNFRRASTTKIYKQIIDHMRKGNPKIDFRINDLNNRPTGLYLEDLKTYITSVHMSTHTEQNGYQNTDRKSRIQTTRYFIGPDASIIPGIPVRIFATPALVKSSIKISVDNGANGIALKHYDGASYSLLRAVRDGLSAAGVKGFTPHLGMEVENMTLAGYSPDSCLMEHCVKTSGTGTAKSVFTSISGVYDIIVSYVDEKEGQSTLTLAVGGKQKGEWKLSEDVGCWRRKTLPGIKIKNGDEIKITGVANGKELARVDYIEFVKK
jgi:Glycosyl hydrolase-like 10